MFESEAMQSFLSAFHVWSLGHIVHIPRAASQTGVPGGHIIIIDPVLWFNGLHERDN